MCQNVECRCKLLAIFQRKYYATLFAPISMLCPPRANPSRTQQDRQTHDLSVDNSSKSLSCRRPAWSGFGFRARSCANSPEALKKRRQQEKVKGFIVCIPAAPVTVCVCVCVRAVCVCVYNFVAILRAIRERLKLFARFACARLTKSLLIFSHCWH